MDPGLSRCGYGAVCRTDQGFEAVAGGVITTPPAWPLPERLAHLAAELRRVVAEVTPEVVVVERVLFQANARTAMSVGQASGLALVAAADAGCSVAQYSANEVKQAVAGYGAATKEQVQRMVAVLCSLPVVPAPPDVADALGLAVCHLTVDAGRAQVTAALAREAEGRASVERGRARPDAAQERT
ncbi:MAG: crossover junction endodeoxyribonuclease RuvC [Acidimicrobiales bacterium]|nr:crossover junction endodeoxyribonuclease RuvC [Acidimicrobiales bacterium]